MTSSSKTVFIITTGTQFPKTVPVWQVLRRSHEAMKFGTRFRLATLEEIMRADALGLIRWGDNGSNAEEAEAYDVRNHSYR